MRSPAAIALIVLAVVLSAPARSPRQKPGRVVTRTRLVALYSDLESQLAAAAQKSDGTRLEQLLADDFEQWSPEPPGDPVPREDWMAAYHPTSFSTSQMAVRAFGDTDVASFVLRQRGTFGEKDANGEFFVVDVWRREGNTARLASRYIAHVPKTSVPSNSPSGKR